MNDIYETSRINADDEGNDITNFDILPFQELIQKLESLQEEPLFSLLINSVTRRLLAYGLNEPRRVELWIKDILERRTNPDLAKTPSELVTSYDSENPQVDLLFHMLFWGKPYDNLTEKEKANIPISKWKPSISTNQDQVYYSPGYYNLEGLLVSLVNEKLGVEYSDFISLSSKKSDEQKKRLFLDGQSIVINIDYMGKYSDTYHLNEILYQSSINNGEIEGPLKNVTLGRAKDENGYYISLYDIYDFDVFHRISYVLNKFLKENTILRKVLGKDRVESIQDIVDIASYCKDNNLEESWLLKLFSNIPYSSDEQWVELLLKKTGGTFTKNKDSPIRDFIDLFSGLSHEEIVFLQSVTDIGIPFEIYTRMYYKSDGDGHPIDMNGIPVFLEDGSKNPNSNGIVYQTISE